MRRVLMLLVVLALPASLFAQSNAIAVFANHPTFRSTSFTDPVEDVTVDIKFDSKVGYGVSYDRFLSPNLSVQFLGQRLRADARAVVSGGRSEERRVGEECRSRGSADHLKKKT